MVTKQPELAHPDTIENESLDYGTSALFGYVSAMSDADFLAYVALHRSHPTVRRSFFNEIRKRAELETGVADRVAAVLLEDIEQGLDRSKNETLIRHLFEHFSMQMRTRVFRSVVAHGTRTTKSWLMRRMAPDRVPDIETVVFEFAMRGDEDALVGIVYRWPLDLWKKEAVSLFKAAADKPWLQRQIVFKTGDPDLFLNQNLIHDPITELYVRAKFKKPATEQLFDAAINASVEEYDIHTGVDRIGLVAWCLGYYGAFDAIRRLPKSFDLASKQIKATHVSDRTAIEMRGSPS